MNNRNVKEWLNRGRLFQPPPLGRWEEAKQSKVCQRLGPETVHALLLPLTLYCRVTTEYSLFCALFALLVFSPSYHNSELIQTVLGVRVNVLIFSEAQTRYFAPSCHKDDASPLFLWCTCVHTDSRTTQWCSLHCIWTLRVRAGWLQFFSAFSVSV